MVFTYCFVLSCWREKICFIYVLFVWNICKHFTQQRNILDRSDEGPCVLRQPCRNERTTFPNDRNKYTKCNIRVVSNTVAAKTIFVATILRKLPVGDPNKEHGTKKHWGNRRLSMPCMSRPQSTKTTQQQMIHNGGPVTSLHSAYIVVFFVCDKKGSLAFWFKLAVVGVTKESNSSALS